MIALPCRAEIRAAVISDLFLAMMNGAFYWRQQHGPDAEVTFFVQARAHIVEARTMALDHARAHGVDWILFIDDDMAPPPDLLPRLAASGKEFVSGLAYRRDPPHEPCVYRVEDGRGIPLDLEATDDPVAVDATGFACLLMHRSVWEAVHDLTDGRPFQYRVGLGEDAYFCNRAREAGIQLWVVPSLIVGHLADVVIGSEHRRRALELSRAGGSLAST
jgi:GT2 family glycosyltransferase